MSADSKDFLSDSSVQVTPLDGGFTENGIPLDDACKYACRPVKDDNGSLIGILFGPDSLLGGDVDRLAKAVLNYQLTKIPTDSYKEETLKQLYFGWVDAPSVIPVVSGYVPTAIRRSGNYYEGIPDLSHVKGLFFASSASINYLIDNKIDLTSAEASGYGLYVPIQSCPVLGGVER